MTVNKHRIEFHDLDGCGSVRTRVFDLSPQHKIDPRTIIYDYWGAVTDILCPVCEDGTIRWAEAGYVSGYRICDGCARHFLASGTAEAPTLLRFGNRRGGSFANQIRRTK